MKSYFLAPISSIRTAKAELSVAMPIQNDTWLLKDTHGDVVAYFNLVERDDVTGFTTISADISGRHYNEDDDVLEVLKKLQEKLGGEITSAF